MPSRPIHTCRSRGLARSTDERRPISGLPEIQLRKSAIADLRSRVYPRLPAIRYRPTDQYPTPRMRPKLPPLAPARRVGTTAGNVAAFLRVPTLTCEAATVIPEFAGAPACA